MWRLAHKWLSPIEYGHTQQTLDSLEEESGKLYMKVPWGKIRAVQQLIRLGVRDVI